MEKTLNMLFAMGLLILIVVLAAPVMAQDGARVEIGNTPTNIRSGPGTEYTIRTVVYRGELTVTGRNDFALESDCRFISDGQWLRVDVQGIEGWVSRCVVQEESNLDAVPIVNPAYPVLRMDEDASRLSGYRDHAGDAPQGNFIVGHTRDNLNVYNAPNLGAERIDTLTASAIYVTGRSADGAWAFVSYEGITPEKPFWAESEPQQGWVAVHMLNLQTDWQEWVPIAG